MEPGRKSLSCEFRNPGIDDLPLTGSGRRLVKEQSQTKLARTLLTAKPRKKKEKKKTTRVFKNYFRKNKTKPHWEQPVNL